MEEQDIDWIVRDRNRFARLRKREQRARGAGSFTDEAVGEVLEALDRLLENARVRFGIEVSTSETPKGPGA